MKTEKILILRLSSIGDILLSSPVIRQIRIAFPEAQIDFVTKKVFSELVWHNPHLDTIYTVNPEHGTKDLLDLRNRFKENHYDYIFDLHNNFRTRILTAFMKKSIIKKDRIKRAQLIYTRKNRYTEILSIPLRYLQVAKKAGVQDDGNGLELYWKNSIEKNIYKKLLENKITNDYITLAPGAAHFTKRWPIDFIQRLIEQIQNNHNWPIIILGSAAEKDSFETLEKNTNVHNFAGSLSLLESAAVLNRARALISNDSGLMHMATAVKTPVVAIFGSTVRELGFFPFRSDHRIVQNEFLECRPCSHIGKAECPEKHFKCMLEISPEKVYNELQSIIKE